MMSVLTNLAIPLFPNKYAPVLFVAYANVSPEAETKLTPGFRAGE
jgi:hypothetical protein